MAKRKNIKPSPTALKIILVLIVTPLLAYVMCREVLQRVMFSDYFKVKSILIDDPALQFIDKQDLSRLRGRNIFAVNLKDIQNKLNAKYPQVSGIKILRNFPDQIQVVAKKRLPFVQISFAGKVLTLDLKGVVLSTSSPDDLNLPMISGIKLSPRIFIGQTLNNPNLQIALRIIKMMRLNATLTAYKIVHINVGNVSNIEFTLSNHLKVIMDWDKIDEKINTLAVMLAQGKFNLNEVNYIDLRFREPVIGKNNAQENHR